MGRFSNVSFLEIANAQKSPLFRFLFLQDVGDTKVKTCKQNFEGEICWVKMLRKANHDSVDQALFKCFLGVRSRKYEATKVVKKK